MKQWHVILVSKITGCLHFWKPSCLDHVQSTKTQKAQLHLELKNTSAYNHFVDSLADLFYSDHSSGKMTMSIFHSSCLLNIMAVCYGACMQHNAWSVECGGGCILFRCQRLFDGLPKLSLQSAGTSVWLVAKFCWTISTDQSNIVKTCVISSQSNLNEATIYCLMEVI